MSSLIALSTSIGVLGIVATWLALGPLSGIFLIWAGFIAWGAYFALGGNADALRSTFVCNLFGILCAWVGAMLIVSIALPIGALSAPVWVGITVFAMVYASRVEHLAAVPASVFGYACTFAYLLQSGKLDSVSLTTVGLENPAITVAISMIIGGVFGALSSRLTGVLAKS